jgi:hypothetical protein
MNDLLPILSGLVGGYASGRAKEQAQNIKLAALARQLNADAATKKYREDMLGFQKAGQLGTEKRATFGEVETLAKVIGNRINDSLINIKGQTPRSQRQSLVSLQEDALPKIAAWRDLGRQKGLSEIELEGILQSHIPYGFRPPEPGMQIDPNWSARYVSAPDIEKLTKLYSDITKRLADNPSLNPTAEWAPFQQSYIDQFGSDAMEGAKLDQARNQFPYAFTRPVNIPTITDPVNVGYGQIPADAFKPENAGIVGNDVYQQFTTPVFLGDTTFDKYDPATRAAMNLGSFGTPVNPLWTGPRLNKNQTQVASFGETPEGIPAKRIVPEYETKYTKRTIGSRTEEQYPQVGVSPETQRTLQQMEAKRADLGLKRIERLVKEKTIRADIAWPYIRNRAAALGMQLDKNRAALNEWATKAGVRFEGARVGMAQRKQTFEEVSDQIKGYGDLVAKMQGDRNNAGIRVAAALKTSSLFGMVKSANPEAIAAFENGTATDEQIKAIQQYIKDNSMKYTVDKNLRDAMTEFDKAEADYQKALSAYKTMSNVRLYDLQSRFPDLDIGEPFTNEGEGEGDGGAGDGGAGAGGAGAGAVVARPVASPSPTPALPGRGKGVGAKLKANNDKPARGKPKPKATPKFGGTDFDFTDLGKK